MAARSTPQQQSDPLADLREAAPAPALPGQGETTHVVQQAASGAQDDAEEAGVYIRPMVPQEMWDELVAETVAAFHQDLTCQGFLHGGGTCGCWYIARQALRCVPILQPEDLGERELEPSSD